MMDDLQKAYTAYQQALYHLPNPKDPSLWYGIGILYDRYGSFEHAEEAFTAVLKMDTKFEKSNEIYFRLGIIHKQQQKYESALEVQVFIRCVNLTLCIKCFRYILQKPPRPLTQGDIWFQIGHVYELQKEVCSSLCDEVFLCENSIVSTLFIDLSGLVREIQRSVVNRLVFVDNVFKNEFIVNILYCFSLKTRLKHSEMFKRHTQNIDLNLSHNIHK
jgi:glucose repression mediator protein